MKHWEYRIIEHDTEGSGYFAIHEVYFDESGKVESWTEKPVTIIGDDQKEIQKQIKHMIKDCKNPVLSEKKLLKKHG